jgi:lipopolysaccharide transport protein LptA
MKIIYTIAIAALCYENVHAQTNLIEAATNSAPAVNSTPRPPTRIDSDSADFDMNSKVRKAFYHGHVVVTDPQMKLTCMELVADIPQAGHISHIVAETNVVIDFADDRGQTNHVTSDKAVYDYHVLNGLTNETVTFTGSPRVENAQSIITAEPIVWDRTKGMFHFSNQKMIFKQSLNFMPTNSPVSNTNRPALTNTNKVSRPK